MVEPQIVVLVVAGSSPVGHPAFSVIGEKGLVRSYVRSILTCDFRLFLLTNHLNLVPVAQPDRASDFGSEGWGFESLQARHFLILSHEPFPTRTR